MRNRKRVGWHRYVNGVTISTLITALFILIPLYWLIASSFKAPNSIGNSPPSLGPTPFSGGNYSNAFVGYDFGIYFRNSLIVTHRRHRAGAHPGHAGRLRARPAADAGQVPHAGDPADDLGLPRGRGASRRCTC